MDAGPALVPGYRSPFELRRSRAGAEVGGLEVAIGEDPVPTVRDAAEGSFGNASVLEVVIGVDDRVPLGDDLIRTNPWRQICALRIQSSTGVAYVGTGWFIGPSVLATGWGSGAGSDGTSRPLGNCFHIAHSFALGSLTFAYPSPLKMLR